MVLIKNWLFFLFFIRDKIRLENVFENILERKKGLSRLATIKTRNLKSGKSGIFPKGVSPWFYSKIGNFSIFLF